MKQPGKLPPGPPRGLSLVEMLVVLAVIGMIAAVAVPSLRNHLDAAQDAQHHRNAQNIVGIFEVGRAAGVEWTVTSVDAAVEDVIRGKRPSGGEFMDLFFSFPEDSPDSVTNAKKYIRLEHGRLTYHP